MAKGPTKGPDEVVSPAILTIHITPAGYLRYATQFLEAAAPAARATRNSAPTSPTT